RQLCREQRQARQELCQALGEAPYNPGFDPATFDSDFNNLTTPNPYLPLALGYRWQYVGGDEIVTIEVRPETKLIAGVTCLVVNDVVSVAGQVVEDTDDWLAQAQNGDVYYCGEEVKDFEYFGGDNPLLPELTSIDGSFKAGRDGDKAGLLLPQSPVAGQVFRQEWSPGKAEDTVEVLATSYRFGLDPDLDQFVPPALAEQVCAAADCLVTRDFTPLEPDALEYKYYAAGIGRFLEVNRATGEIVQLVSCNVDPRCETLSAPEGE
ncbi:MAG TPA: hypothetical protein PKD98_28670, partial [Anaerolineae bacterium]|nr:hypothetical protein [Anaerolineae bacterium]